MKPFLLFTTCFLILTGFTYANLNPSNVLQKRESGALSCYSALNLADFSALCPPTNYPDQQGLNPLEVLYFAMRGTTVPDNTVYTTGQNIICVAHGPGPNITVTAGAGATVGPVNAGASITFTFSLTGSDLGSICIFPEGVPNSTVSDSVTLAQARDLVYTLITDPNSGCKTCGRIPIRYPNVTDGINKGGILKVDYKSDDNCIGTCVGPHSFNPNTTPSPSATAKSAAKRLEISGHFQGLWILTIMTMTALLGSSSILFRSVA